ncbi:MAG: CoA-binding protein [Candidatus Kerfeldbacteria bacterium]|nr:CoA-binding protein [Candidatus Kerfeldbacteria bacterium]
MAGKTRTLHHAPLKDVHPFVSKHYRYAVVGASENPSKYGHIVFFDLKNAGFAVTPVHPTMKQLGDIPAAPSLRHLVGSVDVAVVVVPPTIGLEVLDDAQAAGIMKLWFQPGAQSLEIHEKAARLGLDVVDDGSCIMVARRLFNL